MGMADQKYSVQSINTYGDVLWYDDLGCLIQYMGTDDWKKYDVDGNYVVLDSSNPPRTQQHLRQRKCKFWGQLIPEITKQSIAL